VAVFEHEMWTQVNVIFDVIWLYCCLYCCTVSLFTLRYILFLVAQVDQSLRSVVYGNIVLHLYSCLLVVEKTCATS